MFGSRKRSPDTLTALTLNCIEVQIRQNCFYLHCVTEHYQKGSNARKSWPYCGYSFFGTKLRNRKVEYNPACQAMLSGLPGNLATLLLNKLLNLSDVWKYPCSQALTNPKQDPAQSCLVKCRHHDECQELRHSAHVMVAMLFTPRVSSFNLNLRRVMPSLYQQVMGSILNAFGNSLTPFNQLRSFHLNGGTPFSDGLINEIELLCAVLPEKAPNLEVLHLPLLSATCCRWLSRMKCLKELYADRTARFHSEALEYLSSKDAYTSTNLVRLHLGVFQHRMFNKILVSRFLRSMPQLKDFSLRDEDRPRMTIGMIGSAQETVGVKVMTYSALKLAIVGKDIFPDPSITQLRTLKIIDRSFRPEYILNSCPDLQRLHIDWQEEFSLSPWERFSADWFSRLLREPYLEQLCHRLSHLELTFPAAYSPNCYSLPLDDFSLFCRQLTNLQTLCLKGCGNAEPLPLFALLAAAPNLNELCLSQCPIDMTYDPYSPIPRVKIFRFENEMTTLMLYRITFLEILVTTMPAIEELTLQPQSQVGFPGFSPEELLCLTRLHNLRCLSIPLSVDACTMNMPTVIAVLSHFPSLEFLVLAWTMSSVSESLFGKNKVPRLMTWLYSALEAQNVNIRVSLHHVLHGCKPSDWIGHP